MLISFEEGYILTKRKVSSSMVDAMETERASKERGNASTALIVL